MEDAALELVQGSKELSKGADTLGSRYAEFDQGIDTMQSGIDVLMRARLPLLPESQNIPQVRTH